MYLTDLIRRAPWKLIAKPLCAVCGQRGFVFAQTTPNDKSNKSPKCKIFDTINTHGFLSVLNSRALKFPRVREFTGNSILTC
jgi:hypothetical protein